MSVSGRFHSNYSVYDFAINNAHGENTQPNMIPLLYGYNIKYHKTRLQDFSVRHPEDEWKYLELQEEALWKFYEKQGFVTMFGFDTVWDFLSHSTGRKILTDHVVSNFYHAGRYLFGYMDIADKERCIGLHYAHYYMLDYLTQYNVNYRGYNRFSYVHLSPGHDQSGTVIRTADIDTKNFLESLLTEQLSHQDEDFVLMLASDHGKHSNEWDKTYEGFLETQLPLHVVIANKDLVRRLQVEDVLRHNEKRLMTRLDWHVTFRHLATVPYGRLQVDSPVYQTWKAQTDSNQSLSAFLEPIPDSRDCADLDIPLQYCSCKEFTDLSLEVASTLPVVSELAQVSDTQIGVDQINSVLRKDGAVDVCFHLSLKEVLKVSVQLLSPEAKTLARNFKIRFSVSEHKDAKFDVIGFMTRNEDFQQRKTAHSAFDTMFPDETGNEVSCKVQVSDKQLIEIFRVDAYAGVCEELARTVKTNAAYCVCKLPYPGNKPLSTVQTQALDSLLSKHQLAIALKGRNCDATCGDLNKGCHPWGMELLNDVRVLNQTWREAESLQTYFNMTSKTTLKFRDLKFTGGVIRDGRGMKLVKKPVLSEDYWMLTLPGVDKSPDCGAKTSTSYAICPCY